MNIRTFSISCLLATSAIRSVHAADSIYFDETAFFIAAGPTAGELIFDGRETQPPGGAGDYSSSSYLYGENCDPHGGGSCAESGPLNSLQAPLSYTPPSCCFQTGWIQIQLPEHQTVVPPYGDIYSSWDKSFAIQVTGNTQSAYLSLWDISLSAPTVTVELNGYTGFIGIIAGPNSLGYSLATLGSTTEPGPSAPDPSEVFSVTSFYLPSAVPEPSTWALFGLGTAAIAVARRRRSPHVS